MKRLSFSLAGLLLSSFYLVSAHPAIVSQHSTSQTEGQEYSINNNGTRIHYRKYGEGPYLVFGHGFPDNELTWNTFQVPVFAQTHTVITPILRGYPPSDVPPEVTAYAIEAYVSDLLVILDHEKVLTATLVMHDVSGSIGQRFALAYPERVEGLILVNTPVLPVWFPLIEFDKSEQDFARYTIPYYTYEPGQPKNISTLVKNFQNQTYAAEIALYLSRSPINGMLDFYNENYPAPPYGQNLSTAGLVQKVPSMILWGEEDPYFSPKMLDGLEAWFAKGLRMVTVPNAGHWVFRDQPEIANREIWSFIEYLKLSRIV